MNIPFEEILAARSGNRRAQGALLGRLLPIVGNMLMSLRKSTRCCPDFDWDGLSQDLLAQTLSDLSSFRGKDTGSFLTWFKRIVISRYHDARRALERSGAKQAKPTSPDPAASPVGIADSAHGPLDAAVAEEQRERLGSALVELPPRSRRLIELRFVEELSFSAIAEQLDLPSANAAECLCRRELDRLRAILGTRPRSASPDRTESE